MKQFLSERIWVEEKGLLAKSKEAERRREAEAKQTVVGRVHYLVRLWIINDHHILLSLLQVIVLHYLWGRIGWSWWLVSVSLTPFWNNLIVLCLVISYLKRKKKPSCILFFFYFLRYFPGSICRPLNPSIKRNESGLFIFIGCLVYVHSPLKLCFIVSSVSLYYVRGCSNPGLCFGFRTWVSFYEWKPRNIDWLLVTDKTIGVHYQLEGSRCVNWVGIMDALFFWNL